MWFTTWLFTLPHVRCTLPFGTPMFSFDTPSNTLFMFLLIHFYCCATATLSTCLSITITHCCCGTPLTTELCAITSVMFPCPLHVSIISFIILHSPHHSLPFLQKMQNVHLQVALDIVHKNIRILSSQTMSHCTHNFQHLCHRLSMRFQTLLLWWLLLLAVTTLFCLLCLPLQIIHCIVLSVALILMSHTWLLPSSSALPDSLLHPHPSCPVVHISTIVLLPSLSMSQYLHYSCTPLPQ